MNTIPEILCLRCVDGFDSQVLVEREDSTITIDQNAIIHNRQQCLQLIGALGQLCAEIWPED